MTDKPEVKDYPPYLDCPRPRVPIEQAEAEAFKPAVRMPKLTTGTKLQIINSILLDCYESLNFDKQPYLNGIIDAVCSVISFKEEEND